MRLIILASGSSGNAALIESGGRAVLVDAGISARETLRRMGDAGVGDVRVEAILLTHEHGDHVRGVRVLARRLGVPVYGTAGTLRAAEACLVDVPEVAAIERGERFAVGGFAATAFATTHDAAEPVGYTLQDRAGRRVAIATDTGFISPEMAAALEGCHALGLEHNHDARMLADGPYPAFLKRRIAGDFGHLSNAAASGALAALSWSGLEHVFALHLSERNNTASHVARALARALAGSAVRSEAVERGRIAGCKV